MYDPRNFTDTYDLYRPTARRTPSGEQVIDTPASATSSSLACRFFNAGGELEPDSSGLRIEYDATMMLPSSQTLRPSARGEQPDHVKVGDRWFTVVHVFYPAGDTMFQRAMLRVRREP